MERERERERGEMEAKTGRRRRGMKEGVRQRDRMKRVCLDPCVVYASRRTRPVTVPRVLV